MKHIHQSLFMLIVVRSSANFSLIFLIFASLLVACSPDTPEEKLEKDIVGIWQGPNACIEFNENGTYENKTSKDVGTWKVIASDNPMTPSKLIMTNTSGTYTYDITLSPLGLTIKDNQGTATYKLTSLCL